jgi:hypothetical protein
MSRVALLLLGVDNDLGIGYDDGGYGCGWGLLTRGRSEIGWE